MRRLILTAGILALFVLALPTAARAQGYIAPFFGFDFGGDAGKCAGSIVTPADCSTNRTAYGFSIGSLSHGILGGEVDLAYAPHFFGDTPTLGGNSVLTFMGNVLVAIPAGPVHPYVSGGLGIIRTKVDQIGDLTNFSDSSFAYNLGGGLMVMLPAHLGFRIDYRYMTTASDITLAGQTLLTSGTKLNFSRVVFALVIH
jgi:opacity protein-like surface antigen